MKLFARLTPLAAFALPLTMAAATISGTVIDKTTNKPAAGDTAVLLDLTQSMQESARTKIDAQGHYTFTVPDNAGMHLVQVEHQKASYYGAVPPNKTTVDIDVYDVAPKVDAVHIYADVARMETDQQGLNVTESYFVRNESKPPKTQLSEHSFEIYLPEGAKLEGATAAGPGGMAVSSSPVPMGDKDHYAFVFPLRPGETRFQIGYHLPYSGSLGLKARVSMAADNVAVMLPKSMSFESGKFQALQGDASGPGTQTYLAINVKPETPVAFTVSGTGSMPREQQNAQGGENGAAGGAGMGAADQGGGPAGADQTAQPGRPGGGLANPIDTPDPLQKYKWWILSGIGLALVIAAAFMLRAKPGQQPVAATPAPSPLTPTAVPRGKTVAAHRAAAPANGAAPQSGNTGTLAALKEELFALETERLEGKISEGEYAEHKAALETLLRRALARDAVTR